MSWILTTAGWFNYNSPSTSGYLLLSKTINHQLASACLFLYPPNCLLCDPSLPGVDPQGPATARVTYWTSQPVLTPLHSAVHHWSTCWDRFKHSPSRGILLCVGHLHTHCFTFQVHQTGWYLPPQQQFRQMHLGFFFLTYFFFLFSRWDRWSSSRKFLRGVQIWVWQHWSGALQWSVCLRWLVSYYIQPTSVTRLQVTVLSVHYPFYHLGSDTLHCIIS